MIRCLKRRARYDPGVKLKPFHQKKKTRLLKLCFFNLISPEACGVAIILISSSGRSLHKNKTSWCQKYLPPPLMWQQSLITYRDLLLCLCPNCSYDLLRILLLLIFEHKSLSSTSACTGRRSQLSTFQFECCSWSSLKSGAIGYFQHFYDTFFFFNAAPTSTRSFNNAYIQNTSILSSLSLMSCGDI